MQSVPGRSCVIFNIQRGPECAYYIVMLMQSNNEQQLNIKRRILRAHAGHLHIDSVRVPLEVSTAFIDTLSYTCNQSARIAHGTDGIEGLQILYIISAADDFNFFFLSGPKVVRRMPDLPDLFLLPCKLLSFLVYYIAEDDENA